MEKAGDPALAAARPSDSTHTFSQWQEGLLPGSGFLIFNKNITFSQWRVFYNKKHISQRPEIISQRTEK